MDYITTAERAERKRAIRLPGTNLLPLLAENRHERYYCVDNQRVGQNPVTMSRHDFWTPSRSPIRTVLPAAIEKTLDFLRCYRFQRPGAGRCRESTAKIFMRKLSINHTRGGKPSGSASSIYRYSVSGMREIEEKIGIAVDAENNKVSESLLEQRDVIFIMTVNMNHLSK